MECDYFTNKDTRIVTEMKKHQVDIGSLSEMQKGKGNYWENFWADMGYDLCGEQKKKLNKLWKLKERVNK